jgi:hypothetical protein
VLFETSGSKFGRRKYFFLVGVANGRLLSTRKRFEKAMKRSNIRTEITKERTASSKRRTEYSVIEDSTEQSDDGKDRVPMR